MGRFFYVLQDHRGRSAVMSERTLERVRLMSALPLKADIETELRNVRFVPQRTSGTMRMRKKDRLAAVSQRPSETFATLPWISEWPLRHCESRPAQAVAGRASGRDWSATRRLWRPCALQRSAAVRDERCDLQWPRCTNSA